MDASPEDERARPSETFIVIRDYLAGRRALAMGLAVASVIALGAMGWEQTEPGLRIDEIVYRTLALFVLSYPSETVPSTLLDVARFGAALIVYSAVGVLVIQALRRSRLRHRAARFTHHVVVLGEGKEAAGIARRYQAAGHKVVAIGELSTADATELARRRVVHLPAVLDDDLGRIIRASRLVIVAASTDDETATIATRINALVKDANVSLLLNDRDLAEQWTRQGRDHAICRTSYLAIAALRVSPPYLEDAMVPPPIVIGDDPVAAELVHRIVAGWHEPGERRRVHCLGWNASWFDEVASELTESATLDWAALRSVADAARVVAGMQAQWQAPPPKFAAQGESIYIACADNAKTISVASSVAAVRPQARVLGLVDDEATWAGWVSGNVSLVSRLRLLTDPDTLELDVSSMLAEEIVADAGRWPFPSDGPSLIGEVVPSAGAAQFSHQSTSVKERVVAIARATRGILLDANYRPVAGPLPLLSPSELTLVADAIRRALEKGIGAPLKGDEVTRRLLRELAARLPVLASRAGMAWSRDAGSETIPSESIQDLALKAHLQYLQTTARTGNPTDSANAWLAWDQLSEVDQLSNIAQVNDIPVKLAMLGLAWRKVSDPILFQFSDDQVETIAIEEHRRWHHFQLRNGRVGHPFAIEYDKLNDGTRELDREPVRHIVEQLAAVGLEVFDPAADPRIMPSDR